MSHEFISVLSTKRKALQPVLNTRVVGSRVRKSRSWPSSLRHPHKLHSFEPWMCHTWSLSERGGGGRGGEGARAMVASRALMPKRSLNK